MVKANMTVRNINLVLPLSQKDTAMRIMETADSNQNVSSAVTPLIGNDLRQSDVDSKTQRSTPLIQIMPGTRTSTTATRTTIIRTMSSALEPSADQYARRHAGGFL